MAVLWQKNKNGSCYQVRQAGNSLRLYTNGVFHSQWNPSRPFSGHLWDLLFLPALFCRNYPALNNVLILGIGGGAVINLLGRFTQIKSGTGVDLDKTHITLAKKYFLEKNTSFELIHDDAVNFVHHTRKRYDFILEDLFCGSELDPADAVRAVTASEKWLKTLNNRLTPNGVLAMNFESKKLLRKSLTKEIVRRAGFKSVFYLSQSRYENAIAICLKEKTSVKAFNNLVKQHILSLSKKERGYLEYAIGKVHG